MEELSKYVFTGFVSLLVGILLQRLKPRVKLRYWNPHSFHFDLRSENVQIRTDSLSIQNLGRQPAKDVEIIHKTRPDFFQFAPPVQFEESNTPSEEHVIRIPSLGAREHVFLQLLSYKNITQLLAVRSADGPATPMQIKIQPWVPQWAQAVATVLLILGAAFATYWLISALWYLSEVIGVI